MSCYSLCQQVVIEFYDSVTKGQALDRWSTSVTTRQSSCEHDSALAAPSVLLYGIGDFTCLIEHIEHDAGIEQVSHGLQVRKFCNHLVELHLLFGSKRSPSVLDLIIISILKPGKPAGSARVLICNRCHHKLIIFTRSKIRIYFECSKFWRGIYPATSSGS